MQCFVQWHDTFCKFNKKGQILCPNLQHGIMFIPGSRSTEFSEQCLVANVGINDEVVVADNFPRKMGNSVAHDPFAFWK